MTDPIAPPFVLRRQAWLVNLSRPLVKMIALYHRVSVAGAEHLPRQGPALLLVKHRATRDSLLLSEILYQYAGRAGNYLMKGKAGGWQNGLLEALGGIKVVRPKDIHRIKDRAARKVYLAEAKEFNQHAYDYVTWLYTQAELVVAYPEGMFFGDRLGPLQTGLITHTLEVEAQYGLSIPLIPIGIQYENLARPRSEVYFRIGPPLSAVSFADPASLIDHLKEQLAQLSGL